MCGKPKTPKVVQSDPAADEQKAKDIAQQKANAITAYQRLGGNSGSLLANWGGAAGVKGNPSAAAAIRHSAPTVAPYVGPTYVAPAAGKPSKNMGSGGASKSVGGRQVKNA